MKVAILSHGMYNTLIYFITLKNIIIWHDRPDNGDANNDIGILLLKWEYFMKHYLLIISFVLTWQCVLLKFGVIFWNEMIFFYDAWRNFLPILRLQGNYPKTKNPREGLVFRCQKSWNDKFRNSFKIINDDFLLKHNAKD